MTRQRSFEVTLVSLIQSRLHELVDHTVHRLLQPSESLHATFRNDRSPSGRRRVACGNDLETSWLRMEATRALGRDAEPEIVAAAVTLCEKVGEHGWVPIAGGFFGASGTNGEITDSEKVWWVQFEALPALWGHYRLTGGVQSPERIDATVHWLEENRDHRYGGWFWGLQRDLSPGPRGSNKGEHGKTSYHWLRALVLTADWIAEARSRSGSARSR